MSGIRFSGHTKNGGALVAVSVKGSTTSGNDSSNSRREAPKQPLTEQAPTNFGMAAPRAAIFQSKFELSWLSGEKGNSDAGFPRGCVTFKLKAAMLSYFPAFGSEGINMCLQQRKKKRFLISNYGHSTVTEGRHSSWQVFIWLHHAGCRHKACAT